MSFYQKLDTILTLSEKKHLSYLFFFTVLIAAIETIGVSIIMPFISIASDFSLVDSNKYYNYAYNLLGVTDKTYFVVIFGVAILVFFLFRLILNSAYVFLVMRFTYQKYDSIVTKLFAKYLRLPYRDYVEKNSSSLTKVIINEAANVTELIWFTLILFSEALVFLFIYSILMYVDYIVTLLISAVLIVSGALIKVIISRKMKDYGIKREHHQKIFYEILNKSFNNIKMLKLQSSDRTKNDFNTASKQYVATKISSGFLQQLPRYIFEFIGFSLVIVIVLYHLVSKDSGTSLLALISIFILGLYRILPSITRMFLSYNTILFQYKSLDIIYDNFKLNAECLGNENITFNNEVKFNNLSFGYDKGNEVISNANLTIKKGDKLAIIGESGSGKSTLVDIIMGLHLPTKGSMLIDDVALSSENIQHWRNNFGYIPQSVYLFEGSVGENVAFGLKEDKEKMIDVLTKANIWKFLENYNGLETQVGESGVMLSGGQKQRIAIARALYGGSSILVLDEATSALDDDTESKIMNEIYELAQDKTLIIIAHRLSTTKRCNKVYKMESKKICLATETY